MSFQGIYGNSEEVGIQKNILAETVRFVFPEPSVFVEETAGSSLSVEGESEHARLAIKCIHCFRNAFDHRVDRGTIKYSSINGDFREAIVTFATTGRKSLTNETVVAVETYQWKIEITAKQLYFGIFASKPIRKMEPLDKNFFSISPCVADRRCSSENSYSRFDDAKTAIERLEERFAQKNFATGKQINESDFDRPTQVKRNDTVKVTFKNDSGLTLRTLGKALQPGRLGDSIEISILQKKNTGTQTMNNSRFSLNGGRSSSNIVRARVSANGEVEIEN